MVLFTIAMTLQLFDLQNNLSNFQVKKRVPLQGEELEKYLEEEKEKAKERNKKQASTAAAKRLDYSVNR